MLGLYIAYLCIKFDHSSFSRSRDMVGAHQNLNGLRDLTTPLSGLWLATINLPTKFEVSISTHYEDMKRDTKCRKWVVRGSHGLVMGHPRSLKIASFDRMHTQILHCRFWYIARHWSKVVDCNIPYLYLGPPLEVTPLKFRRDLRHQ